MADHERPFQSERFDEAPDDLGLFRQSAGGSSRPHRIARSRPVERDQPVARAKAAKQRVPELVELRAKSVHEHDRPPLARFDIVDAVAVDLDELSAGRHQSFGLGRNPERRRHQAADDDESQQKQTAKQP